MPLSKKKQPTLFSFCLLHTSLTNTCFPPILFSLWRSPPPNVQILTYAWLYWFLHVGADIRKQFKILWHFSANCRHCHLSFSFFNWMTAKCYFQPEQLLRYPRRKWVKLILICLKHKGKLIIKLKPSYVRVR